MSVRPIAAQRSFYHTDYLAGDLFGSTNRYRLFREKIWPKLLELAPKLDALYCAENGRPPIDPVLLCGVTLLQFMERAADRRASEQVVYHLGWKYALGLELDYDGLEVLQEVKGTPRENEVLKRLTRRRRRLVDEQIRVISNLQTDHKRFAPDC